MSNKAMSWAVNVKDIDAIDRLILMLLADCHNGKTGQCNPRLKWLQDRTGLQKRGLLRRLGLLEDGGLIKRDTKAMGHGKGKRTDYTLHFTGARIENELLFDDLDPHDDAPLLDLQVHEDAPLTDLQVHDGAPLDELQVHGDAPRKSYRCTGEHLQVHGDAPPYKEEPEKNRNNINSISFDDARKRYLECPSKAKVQNRKKAKAAWEIAVRKVEDPKVLLDAINEEIRLRTNPVGFIAALPDMFRWLRDERWLDLEPPSAPEQQKSEIDWQEAARNFVRLGIWPFTLGPRPNVSNCEAPEDILLFIAKAALAEGNMSMIHPKWLEAVTGAQNTEIAETAPTAPPETALLPNLIN